MSLSADRNTPVLGAGGVPVKTSYPVAASTVIYKGGIVCLDSAGNAVPGNTSTGVITAGVALTHVDNSTGAAAALSVEVEQGCFRVGNHSSLTKSAVGALAYIYDDASVQSSGSVLAGTIYMVDSSGIWVYMGLDGPLDASALTTFTSNLASASTGEGASLVGIEDAAGYFAATNVEAALVEATEEPLFSVTIDIPALSAVADATVLMRFKPLFKCKITSMSVTATTAVTTSAKATTLTPKIGGTPVTGGVCALTSANLNAIGATVYGTAVTGAQTVSASAEVTVVASSTTAFSEGAASITIFFGRA